MLAHWLHTMQTYVTRERVPIAEQDDASQSDRQDRVEDVHQRTFGNTDFGKNNESVRYTYMLGAAPNT